MGMMRFFGNLMLRIFMVSLGYFFAVMAAGIFVAIGFQNELEMVQPPMEAWEAELFAWLPVAIGVASAVLIGAYSFTVAGLFILLADIMRLKGMVTNILLGGLCAAIIGFLGLGPEGLDETSDGAIMVALGAGFIGGFVYWVIAGSSAGNWRGPEKKQKS